MRHSAVANLIYIYILRLNDDVTSTPTRGIPVGTGMDYRHERTAPLLEHRLMGTQNDPQDLESTILMSSDAEGTYVRKSNVLRTFKVLIGILNYRIP